MKTIVIAGASGFVGTHLTQLFKKEGYEVIALRRNELKNSKALTKKIRRRGSPY